MPAYSMSQNSTPRKCRCSTRSIVADSEANLREKKLAQSTPVAQGLLGHKLGEVVEIKIPAGTAKFEIVEISF